MNIIRMKIRNHKSEIDNAGIVVPDMIRDPGFFQTGSRVKPGMTSNSGFSLIEIVIATGMLAVLAILVSGIFVRFITIQRHDIAQQSLQEDIRFALELINREIRTGYGSTFALVDGGGGSITFRNQNGLCVNIRLAARAGRIERGEVSAPGDDCPTDLFSSATFAPLTSPSTIFHHLRFDLVRSQSTSEGLPDRQGMVTIMVDASAKEAPSSTLKLQSTVTSRQVSIYQGL